MWQCGPAWLVKDETEWPVTKVESQLTETEKDDVQKYFKSQKEACISNIETKTYSSNIETKNFPSNIDIDDLIKRCGDLQKLIRSAAYILCLMGRRPLVSGVREVTDKAISAEEYDDAWKFLISLEQIKLDLKKQRRLQCSEIKVELSGKRKLTQIILSPRIKNFPISFSSNKNIPILTKWELCQADCIVLSQQIPHRY